MSAKKVHLIGIGGTGLSAIARVLVESGYAVTGSDRQASPFTRELEAAGVQVFIGHRPENLSGAELVVRSSAIPDSNVEVQAARQSGIPVLKRADFLGQIMQGRQGIAVAGSHGKTTTTAMIAWVLAALDQDPTFIIGGVSTNLGVNAHAGQGHAFVIEADEYDHMFLGLKPQIAVVTNMEHDHPDMYPSPESYQQAFSDFIQTLAPDGLLLACANDPGAAWLLEQARQQGRRVLAYGISEDAAGSGWAYRARNLAGNLAGGYSFEAVGDAALAAGGFATLVNLQAPGEHNVRNALAALAVAHQMGLSLVWAAEALGSFRGTGRRFEVLGEAGGVVVVDDYAHHPTEIRATLAAARARYPQRRLWAVWQPHTYSRTQTLFGDYTGAFQDANRVVVTEVYPAREPVSSDFSARQVVEAMPHPEAIFIPDIQQVSDHLLALLEPGDVLLVLSAGDADQISARVYAALRERSSSNA